MVFLEQVVLPTRLGEWCAILSNAWRSGSTSFCSCVPKCEKRNNICNHPMFRDYIIEAYHGCRLAH